jgi:hypothetical protein
MVFKVSRPGLVCSDVRQRPNEGTTDGIMSVDQSWWYGGAAGDRVEEGTAGPDGDRGIVVVVI